MKAKKPHEDAKICGAKKRKGGKCQNAPMANGRCRLHGGLSTGRPIITGRHSKFLPVRMASKYDEAMSDAELLSLRSQYAFLDVLLQERMSKLGDETSAELWAAAQDAFRELQSSWRKALKGDKESIAEIPQIIDRIAGILANGYGQHRAEAEARQLIQEQVGVAKQETVRLEKMGQFITAQALMAILARVVDIVNQHVQDRESRAAIAHALGELSALEA